MYRYVQYVETFSFLPIPDFSQCFVIHVVSESLALVDIVTRQNLTKLLGGDDSASNWEALARLFRLDDLMPTLSSLSSPANALIDHLEVKCGERPAKPSKKCDVTNYML